MFPQDLIALAYDAAQVFTQAVNRDACLAVNGTDIGPKEKEAMLTCLKRVSCAPRGGGNSHRKVTGVLVWLFESDPKRYQDLVLWAWNQVNLTPIGRFTRYDFCLQLSHAIFRSAPCSRHEKIVYDFRDIKLPVATIVVGFWSMFQRPTTIFVSYTTIASKL